MVVLCLTIPCLNPVSAARQTQSAANDFALQQPLSARATVSPAGVLVEWASAFETNTLGFNVYRVAGGSVSKLNPDLLAGPALISNPRSRSYAWFDPAGATNSTYEVESVDLWGRPSLRVLAVNVWSAALPPYQQAELLSNLAAGRQATQVSNPEWQKLQRPIVSRRESLEMFLPRTCHNSGQLQISRR
jgi:hypothetical protein